MERMNKISTVYECPSVVELQVANEGILCTSEAAGTENLVVIEGSWK